MCQPLGDSVTATQFTHETALLFDDLFHRRNRIGGRNQIACKLRFQHGQVIQMIARRQHFGQPANETGT